MATKFFNKLTLFLSFNGPSWRALKINQNSRFESNFLYNFYYCESTCITGNENIMKEVNARQGSMNALGKVKADKLIRRSKENDI